MRFIDFIVFFTMANFKRRKMDGLTWASPLARAVFLATLSVSLLLFIAAEIICFTIWKLNILDTYFSIIVFIIGGLLIGQLLGNLYITKKRYEYIASPEYKPFRLSITAGVTICFLLFVFSFLGSLGTAIIINILLTKK
jgi:hypothetical protein